MSQLLTNAAVTAATARRFTTLRAALNGAVRRRLIPYNRALHVELPAQRSTPSPVWTPGRVGQFLDA